MTNKILIIQTAFIGDVILATSLVEYTKKLNPNSEIHFLCRKGNESILENNPNLKKIHIWDKSKQKFRNLLKLSFSIRKERFDYVLNIQRFFNSGFLTALSGAKFKVGFHSNPLSFSFSKKILHQIPHKAGTSFFHEVQRNAQLLSIFNESFTVPTQEELPLKIYFNQNDKKTIDSLSLNENYIVLAPASVWFTKQWELNKWKELILALKQEYKIVLIGAPSDKEYLKPLEQAGVLNLSGKLNLRESALLMKKASQVFVNDSAPLHLASSVDAKVTAIFCSTVPDFGYGPIAKESRIIQVSPRLDCMPCGLHGHKKCPLNHFKCSSEIKIRDLTLF